MGAGGRRGGKTRGHLGVCIWSLTSSLPEQWVLTSVPLWCSWSRKYVPPCGYRGHWYHINDCRTEFFMKKKFLIIFSVAHGLIKHPLTFQGLKNYCQHHFINRWKRKTNNVSRLRKSQYETDILFNPVMSYLYNEDLIFKYLNLLLAFVLVWVHPLCFTF